MLHINHSNWIFFNPVLVVSPPRPSVIGPRKHRYADVSKLLWESRGLLPSVLPYMVATVTPHGPARQLSVLPRGGHQELFLWSPGTRGTTRPPGGKRERLVLNFRELDKSLKDKCAHHFGLLGVIET